MSSSSHSSLSLSPWGILRDDLVEIPILAVAIDRECVQFQHTGGLLKLGQGLAGPCWRMVGIGALLRRVRDEHLHEEPSGLVPNSNTEFIRLLQCSNISQVSVLRAGGAVGRVIC